MYYDNATNVRASAKRFFREARAHRGKNLSVGQLAQAVQRSAYPERYQTHLAEARRLLSSGGISDIEPTADNPRRTIEVPDRREAMAAAFISGRKDILNYASELLASGAYTRKTTLPDDPERVEKGARGHTGASGKVNIAPGADRKGAKTNRAVIEFGEAIAGLVGHSLTLGTGTQHNRMTTSGNVSDHWDGHAGDFPASGKRLTKMGQAALIAAGKSPAWARKQKGGVYNVMYNGHRVQILFNTNVGGNHWDHLHAGIR